MDAEKALAEGKIEKGIVELVKAFNSKDKVDTCASCEGHVCLPRGFSNGKVVQHPFVMFTAPESLVSSLARELNNSLLDGELNYSWTLKAHFNSKFDFKTLVWVIRVDDNDLIAKWSPGRVVEDALKLSRIISKI